MSRLEDRVIAFLTQYAPKRFTVAQIAQALVQLYPEQAREKQARREQRPGSSDKSKPLAQQIGAEISRGLPIYRSRYPLLQVIGERPRQLYIASIDSDEAETDGPKKVQPCVNEEGPAYTAAVSAKIPAERELYPLVHQFLADRLELYTKYVDEKRSKNTYGKNGNKWLHPDIISVEDLTAHWHTLVKGCVKEEGGRRARVWAFEVKRELDIKNVREHFYQAVSNSSWANFGYLIAVEIEERAMAELRILSATHGIGVIVLDVNDPVEGSEIRLPARERQTIDWGAWNRIATENEDAQYIVHRLQRFLQSGEFNLAQWDSGPVAPSEPGAPKRRPMKRNRSGPSPEPANAGRR